MLGLGQACRVGQHFGVDLPDMLPMAMGPVVEQVPGQNVALVEAERLVIRGTPQAWSMEYHTTGAVSD